MNLGWVNREGLSKPSVLAIVMLLLTASTTEASRFGRWRSNQNSRCCTTQRTVYRTAPQQAVTRSQPQHAQSQSTQQSQTTVRPNSSGHILPFREFGYITPERRAQRPVQPTARSSMGYANQYKQYSQSTAGMGDEVNACFWERQPTLVVIIGGDTDGDKVREFLTKFGENRFFAHATDRVGSTLYNSVAGMMGFFNSKEKKKEEPPPSLTVMDDLQLMILNDSERIWDEQVYNASNYGKAVHIAKNIGHRDAIATSQPNRFQPLRNLGKAIKRGALTNPNHHPGSQWFDKQFASHNGYGKVNSSLYSEGKSASNELFSETSDELVKNIPKSRFKIEGLMDKTDSNQLLRTLLPGGTKDEFTVAILGADGNVAKGPDEEPLVWNKADEHITTIAAAYFQELEAFKESNGGKSRKLNHRCDSDGDGVLDKDDHCKNTNPGDKVTDNGSDRDGCHEKQSSDNAGSYPDEDNDGDGVVNSKDQCPNTRHKKPLRVWQDGQYAGCEGGNDGQRVGSGLYRTSSRGPDEEDDDGDGVINKVDICPNTWQKHRDFVSTTDKPQKGIQPGCYPTQKPGSGSYL